MKIQKEQEMGLLLEKWQQSGKTKTVFCKDEGLIKSTFYYWIKKLQAPQVAVKKKSGFTPLLLEQHKVVDSKQPVVRINYSSGVSIDFFEAVAAGYLKDLCH